MRDISRAQVTELEQIPNVGPAIAAMMRTIGVNSPQDLVARDPYEMYGNLCDTTGARQDACVIDAFISAVRFMAGESAKPWWKYTDERKRTLATRAPSVAMRPTSSFS